MDIESIYNKVYRYVYFKLHSREASEDITQEVFLRYLGRYGQKSVYNMRLMYIIARNLCIDEYRRERTIPLPEDYELPDAHARDEGLQRLMVRDALRRLSEEEKEMLLLRYVNEESITTISELYKCSRFAIYRRLKAAAGKFQAYWEETDHDE